MSLTTATCLVIGDITFDVVAAAENDLPVVRRAGTDITFVGRTDSVSFDGEILAWSLPDGRVVNRSRLGSPVTGLFANSGRVRAYTRDGRVHQWDPNLRDLLMHATGVCDVVAVAEVDQRSLLGTKTGQVVAWDWDAGTLTNLAPPDNDLIVALEVEKADETVVAVGSGGEIRRLTSVGIATVGGESGGWQSIRDLWMPEAEPFVVEVQDFTIRLWNPDVWQNHMVVPVPGVSHLDLVDLVHGVKILGLGRQGALEVWNLSQSGAHRRWMTELVSGDVVGLAVLPSAGRLAAALTDGTVRFYRLDDGCPLAVREVARSPLAGLIRARDDAFLVTYTWEGDVRAIDSHSGRGLTTADTGDPIGSAVLCGTELVLGGLDGTLRAWNLTTSESSGHVAAHRGPVVAVSSARSGNQIMAGSWDGTSSLLEINDGLRFLRRFEGHAAPVNNVILNGPQGFAVSTSVDRTVRLWSTNTGRCVTGFRLVAEPKRAVSVEPREALVVLDILGGLSVWTISRGVSIR